MGRRRRPGRPCQPVAASHLARRGWAIIAWALGVLPDHINARVLATPLGCEVDMIAPFDIGAFAYPAAGQLSPSGSAPSSALFLAGSCGALTLGIAESVVG